MDTISDMTGLFSNLDNKIRSSKLIQNYKLIIAMKGKGQETPKATVGFPEEETFH